MRSGRIGILGLGRGTLEWVTPVLYVRGPDTRLFDVADLPPDESLGAARRHRLRRRSTESRAVGRRRVGPVRRSGSSLVLVLVLGGVAAAVYRSVSGDGATALGTGPTPSQTSEAATASRALASADAGRAGRAG